MWNLQSPLHYWWRHLSFQSDVCVTELSVHLGDIFLVNYLTYLKKNDESSSAVYIFLTVYREWDRFSFFMILKDAVARSNISRILKVKSKKKFPPYIGYDKTKSLPYTVSILHFKTIRTNLLVKTTLFLIFILSWFTMSCWFCGHVRVAKSTQW